MKGIAFAALATLLMAGCVRRLTDFTIISTKNVDLSRVGEYRRYDRRTRGAHGIMLCCGASLLGGEPSLKTALDRAIEKAPGGVALVDGVLYQRQWTILGLFGGDQIIAEGTPLIDPDVVRGK